MQPQNSGEAAKQHSKKREASEASNVIVIDDDDSQQEESSTSSKRIRIDSADGDVLSGIDQQTSTPNPLFPPSSQRHVLRAPHLRPEQSLSSIAESSVSGSPAPTARVLEFKSPVTPVAMREFASTYMPNLKLPAGQFFTIEQLQALDLSSLQGFSTPSGNAMIAVADKSYLFRQHTEEWYQKAVEASATLSVNEAVDRIIEYCSLANKHIRPTDWARQVTFLHLFVAQFCVKYKDNYKAERGGTRPTTIDCTLLLRLGMDMSKKKALEGLSVGTPITPLSTTGITALKTAGGVPFNYVLHFFIMRFPQIVIGQPTTQHVQALDRGEHMYSSPLWQPVRDGYEKAFLSAFSFGYLSEGLLPETGYSDVFVKYGHLPRSDWVTLREIAQKERGCEIFGKMTIDTIIHNAGSDTGDVKSFKSHFLSQLVKLVVNDVKARINVAIEANQREQLETWAAMSNDSLFQGPGDPVQSQSGVDRTRTLFRALSQSIMGVTKRTNDDPLNLVAATLLRDYTYLEEGSNSIGRIPCQYLGSDGEIVRIFAPPTGARDLLDAITTKLRLDFFEPMLAATITCFPQISPASYIPPNSRHQDLSAFSGGLGAYTGTKAHGRLLRTGVIGLQRRARNDMARQVVEELPPLGSSQDPQNFTDAENRVIDLVGALNLIRPQWDTDLAYIATPEVQAKITSLYAQLQLHNNLWAKTSYNQVENKSCDMGVSSMLDMRTLARRILSSAVDDGDIAQQHMDSMCHVFDKIICVAVHLKHPAIWTLSTEIMIGALASFPQPISPQAALIHQELFLIMRHGVTTVITRSDAQRQGGTGWTSDEAAEKHRASILRSITFVVQAQRSLCSNKQCRRVLHAHPDTCPAIQLLSSRQLTTSAVFTRVGLRELVIKGGCGVPPAIFKSSRGPCPWEYWTDWLSDASLAALLRIAKLEHRRCKPIRDRPSQASLLAARGLNQDQEYDEENEDDIYDQAEEEEE